MRTGKALVISFLFVSGVAIACKTLPLPVPPVPVKVSWTDVAKATAAGYSNPLNAAALIKLDGLAGNAVGESNWIANNFVGNFVVSGPMGGAVSIPVDKPCNKKAQDSAAQSSSNGSASAGGGGAGAPPGGGGGYFLGGGCYGSCGTGEAGDLEEVVTNPV